MCSLETRAADIQRRPTHWGLLPVARGDIIQEVGQARVEVPMEKMLPQGRGAIPPLPAVSHAPQGLLVAHPFQAKLQSHIPAPVRVQHCLSRSKPRQKKRVDSLK